LDYCSQCGKKYDPIVSQDVSKYSGGVLIVTDIPVSKCECNTLVHLGNEALISYFSRFLEGHDMIGDISVSMSSIKSKFDLNEIMISKSIAEVLDNTPLQIQINWMKEKLSLASTEELFSKALSLLYMAIQLEERGYTIKGYKKLGLLEGTEHINFKIRP
jgi:hypothetical protein